MAETGVGYRATDILGAGLVGALILLLFEMLAATLLQAPAGPIAPLRIIATIVLGPTALQPEYPVTIIALIGTLVHLVLSVVYTFIFAALVSPLWTAGRLIAVGIGFGILVWAMNSYVMPLGGRWLQDRSNPLVQLAVHAFFFGCPVAWTLSRAHVALRS